MSTALHLARPELIDLVPYSHAEWEPTLERLHANELPWRTPGDNSPAGLNRYPEPQPQRLVARLAELYDVAPDQVLIGRGSDEAIDLLVRAFCRAQQDRIMVFPPTFGMYEVAARIQGAAVAELPLDRARGFALDESAILDSWQPGTKLLFFCSPNNPTGNLLDSAVIERIVARFASEAIVVIDEAYAEFSGVESFSTLLEHHVNLVVLRTLSKAYALAGARCGALLGDPPIVELLRRLIPPYAVPSLTLDAALTALEAPHRAMARAKVDLVVAERERMTAALGSCRLIAEVWPSAANFLLVRCTDAQRAFRAAVDHGLLVRDLRGRAALADCLRITIGTPEQNDRLLNALGAA
ncbi:MAG TPA: histidinol-phosphate transaminase [Steroidobacteraceae bacterium]|nr:histidinol-phosphate transaminase [Steroidobacteraceae bacterium]